MASTGATDTARRSLVGPIESGLTFVGECALITMDAIGRFGRRPFEVREIVNQMAFIGVASVPIVVLTSFFSGAVLALYSAELFLRYGAGEFVGATVGFSATREIAPVLAGIMVSARCGSAMAAQIGTMAVTEQVDALRMLSVHPTNYLVIPRMTAAAFMTPVLALIGMYAAIGGGYVVSVSNGIAHGAFLSSIRQYLEPSDFIGGLYKAPVFGIIVAVVACQQGLRTTNGAVGVGRSTTNSVVISMVLVYVADYFLSELIF